MTAEDAAILRAGMVSVAYLTIDNTGALHRHYDLNTIHVCGERFTVFHTKPPKSRLNFMSVLRGNNRDYVRNNIAFGYLNTRYGVDPNAIARLRTLTPNAFVAKCHF